MERRVLRNWFLHVRVGDFIFTIDEDNFWEALDIQLDLMSPMGPVTLAREPTLENLLKAAYMPSAALAGAGLASYWTGTPFWSLGPRAYQGVIIQGKIDAIKLGGRVLRSAGPRLVQAGVLVGMYMGVRSYFHHLASLDWVPDLYTI
jgi:hypothetical protein